MNPLVLAAIPAFLGSLFLMYRGEALPTQFLQQALVFVVSAIVCAVLSRKPVVVTERAQNGFLAGAVLALLATLLIPGDGPHRWIGTGGFRLYLASAVLPGTLLLLTPEASAGTSRPVWPLATLVAVTAVLAAQPDASQATAFALAGLAFLRQTPLSLSLRAGVGVALAGVVCLAWLRPDPLKPVPYVEGVLELAQAVSPLALVIALLFLALPIAVLLRQSRGTPDRAGIFLVVIYYVSLGFFAYRQLTPMPLLGFGAGPILGYFGMAPLVAWKSKRPCELS